MPVTPELLQQAIEHQRGGRLAEAETVYVRLLDAEPNNVDALRLYATLLHHRGKNAEAIACLRKAIAAQPQRAELHHILGNVLHAVHDFEGAVSSFRSAVYVNPGFLDARLALGTALRDAGRPQEAVECFRQVVAIQPNHADAQSCLGILYFDLAHYDEAIACQRAALRLRPDFANAWCALGAALKQQGDYAQAADAFHEALRFQPNFPQAANNLGTALKAIGRVGEAIGWFDEALRMEIGALGIETAPHASVEEVLAAFDRVAGPIDGTPHSENTAVPPALRQQAQALRGPIALRRHNRAMALLLLGQFSAGWPELEWRLYDLGLAPWSWKQPRWNGSPLAGRTILLHAEQGLGDTMQFIRYAPLVKQRGGRVIVACPPSMIPILSTCPGVDGLCSLLEPLPPFDVYAALLSLPGIFGTDLSSIPRDIPYLAADDALVEKWRNRLGDDGRLCVGIGWQGSTQYGGDRERSIRLAEFSKLAAVPGVRLLSLQKGIGCEQLAQVSFPVEDLAGRLDEQGAAFVDTAAVIENLDLVITSDSSRAHLAGALGAPTWVAVPAVPDWRWLMDRADSPWYPTMRLFRQRTLSDWPSVFAEMASELSRLVRIGRQKSPDT